MKRKKSRRSKTYESPAQGVWARLPVRQIAVAGGVLILIGVVLFLKLRQSSAGSAGPVAAGSTTETMNTTIPSPTPNLLPEARLDHLLQAGEPVFLFFHSNNCVQCVKMTGIVEQVYPDFSDTVPLIDVNVYDEQNRNLLQRANIRVIPTLIFIDREGKAAGHAGVMEPDALREQLRQLEKE